MNAIQSLPSLDFNTFADLPCVDRLKHIVAEFLSCPQANIFYENLPDITFTCLPQEKMFGENFRFLTIITPYLFFSDDLKPKEMFNALNEGLHELNIDEVSKEITTQNCDEDIEEVIRKLAAFRYQARTDANELIQTCSKDNYWNLTTGAEQREIKPFKDFIEETREDSITVSRIWEWANKCIISKLQESPTTVTIDKMAMANMTASA